MPPHCPYSGTVPPDVGVGVVLVFVEVVVVVVFVVGVVVVLFVVGVVVEAEVVVGPPPPGTTVGTVLGCKAVFQVAVVGQSVVAIVGTVVPYGVGPGIA